LVERAHAVAIHGHGVIGSELVDLLLIRHRSDFLLCKAAPHNFVDLECVRRYLTNMLKSFRNKALQRFFETGNPRGLSVQDDKRVARILRALEAASKPEDMDLPGYRFHGLSGDQKGRYSVRVNGNWRITFGWDGEDIIEVELEDYH
jgi:toxin HigB-1